MPGFLQKSTPSLLLLLGLVLAVGCSRKPPTKAERLAQADALKAQGEVTAALASLEAIEAEFPEAVDVLEALAFTYVTAGDSAAAAITFARLAELDPSQNAYLLYAADTLRAAGDLAGASGFYNQYLEREPDDVGFWLTLAQFEQKRGRRSDALTAYLRAQRLDPRGETELLIAGLYGEAGNLAQAQTWYAQAAARGGEYRADGLLGLFNTAMQAERFSDASELLTTIDAEFPGTFDASPYQAQRQSLQTWQTRQEEAAQALAALNARQERLARREQQQTSREETTPPANGTTVVLLDRDPTVVRTPEGETTNVPFDAETPPRVAQIQVNPPTEGPMDAPDASDTSDSTAPVALFPEPGETAVNTNSNRPPRQRLSYRELLEEAESAERAGEYAQAARHYTRALAQTDTDVSVWMRLSEAQLRANNLAFAQAAASEARRRAPTNPATSLQWLRVGQQAFDRDRFIREMDAARRQHPRSAEVTLAVARGYLNVAQNRRATRALYLEFLRLAPVNHPERAAVETELRGL